MENDKKYVEIFKELFEVDEDTAKNLHYQDIDAWDSVGHMTLIAEIEDKFGIDMEADDIIDFESFEIGRKLLSEKYDIRF